MSLSSDDFRELFGLSAAAGEHGEAMFRHACAMGLEGIVSKKMTAPYLSGRRSCWRKIKNPAYERR